LVEVSDWGYDASQPPVAYVPQELLAAPEFDDDGATWTQVCNLKWVVTTFINSTVNAAGYCDCSICLVFATVINLLAAPV
jgi:hypothetical protein